MIQHGKNGWLVPPNDAEALARTINVVLDNDGEREKIGRAAYKRARDFSTEEFGHKVVGLYQRMMTRASA
jgi:glycosyltransferase involved in cell wall biosynthesis